MQLVQVGKGLQSLSNMMIGWKEIKSARAKPKPVLSDSTEWKIWYTVDLNHLIALNRKRP